jgi:excisionase family DNA binding protein
VSLASDLLAGAEAAARYIGVSRRVVYGLTDRGLLPVVRMGRRLYYSKAALNAAFSNPMLSNVLA